VSDAQNSQGPASSEFIDTLVLAAKRLAFDSPTQASLDGLISAVRQERYSALLAEVAALRKERDALKKRELDNHHNALACPYCNPDNLTLAAQPPAESMKAIKEHQSGSVAPTASAWQPRFFRSAKGFEDDTLFVRIDPDGRGFLVLNDGRVRRYTSTTLTECLAWVANGSWREFHLNALPPVPSQE
jgi:hypothetical protein